MSLLENIDFVLYVLSKAKKPSILTEGEIAKKIQEEGKQISTYELIFILNKLVKDRYVDRDNRSIHEYNDSNSFHISNTMYYNITYDGIIFLSEDGYTGVVNRRNAEKTRMSNVEKSQRANEKQMIYLTAVLAVFAFASLCKDIAVLIMDKDKKFVAVEMTTYSFIFLFGLIAGLIIYMLISEGFSRRKD